MKFILSFILCASLTAWADNAQPQAKPSATGLHFSPQPTATEISNARVFDEPLLSVGGEPTPAENKALADALASYGGRTNLDDFSALTDFLARFPQSTWNSSLLLHLGTEYYNLGYYSRALEAWEQAWPQFNSANDAKGKAQADLALGELVKMYSKLGRMRELEQLLDSTKGRALTGPATQMIANGKDAIWLMKHHPEICFRCGPMALDRILSRQDRSKGANPLIVQSASTTNGFSLSQVAELSHQLGMNYQIAFRSPGAPLIAPAVLHWSAGHYAALLEQKGDRCLIQDPTFYSSLWMTVAAIDQESSGYFLVPAGTLPKGWRSVGDGEASAIFGKGDVGGPGPGGPGPTGPSIPPNNPPCPMTTYSMNIGFVSLTLMDTPVGYTPPVGPWVKFQATYNEGEPNQPATFYYSNLGPKWTCNWISYITDNPNSPGADVSLYESGGGTLYFGGFNPNTQTYAPELETQAILTLTSASSYLLTYPNGASRVLSMSDGSVGTSRRVFLTQVLDPAGNAAQLNYDAQLRITNIVDAIGQPTAFFYTNSAFPNAITEVKDPFGRFATLQYYTNGLLSQITDVLGLTSRYTYDTNDFVTTLTTPYGSTTFSNGQATGNNWLSATDPLGATEFLEFNDNSPIPQNDPPNVVPHGMGVLDTYLIYRNSYYWSKQAYQLGAGDYTKATIYHFCHDSANTSVESDIPESIKKPLENRVWYIYPGQSTSIVNGTSSHPSAIGRVLNDGTSQVSYYQYNPSGNVVNAIDPVGRNFTYIYATNNQDLLEVHMTHNGKNELQSRRTYNTQHSMLTFTDASGQTSSNTYNARGQLLTAIDPLGEVNTYSYATNGYLLSVTGPLQTTNDITTYTYDGFGRVRTATDAQGYTLTFDYDAADRKTRIAHPDGTFEQFVYSNLDLVAFADRIGRWTTNIYDASEHLIQTIDPLGRATTFDRCRCGALDGITDPMGRTTTWNRDVQSRPIAKHYADGSTITYVYDNTISRIQSRFDEKGQQTFYEYYADNKLKRVSYPNATIATPTVTYTYDRDYDRLLSVQDGIGTTTYSYNPVTTIPALGAGQLASTIGPLPNSTVSYQYDALGRSTNRAINGVAQTVKLDDLGRPIMVTNALGVFQYSYVGATPRLALEAYPNGQTNLYSYYGNIGDDRLAQIQHLYPNGSLLSGFGYTYNPTGEITVWTNEWDTLPTRVWTLGYDAADQVTNVSCTGGTSLVTNYAYTYDSAGNRLLATTNGIQNNFSYNSLNQLESSGTGPTNANAYEWDAENRLIAISQGTNRSEFSYDGSGRRIEILEKANGFVITNNYFLWCGNQICDVRDASGASVLRRFFPQGESLTGSTSNTNYFYTKDHLGSIREATSTNGAIQTRLDYDPYGQTVVIQNNVQINFGYSGYFVHTKSGLSLALYRIYDSTSARWLSRDPLQERRGLNMYLYAQNNSINEVDLLGLLSLQEDITRVQELNDSGFEQYATTIIEDYLKLPSGTGDIVLYPGEGLGIAAYEGLQAGTDAYYTGGYQGFLDDILNGVNSVGNAVGVDTGLGNYPSGGQSGSSSDPSSPNGSNGPTGPNGPNGPNGPGPGPGVPPTPGGGSGGNGCDCGPLCEPNNSAGGGGNPSA